MPDPVPSARSGAAPASPARKPRAALLTTITVVIVVAVSVGAYGLTLLRSTIAPWWFVSSASGAALLRLSQQGTQLTGTLAVTYLSTISTATFGCWGGGSGGGGSTPQAETNTVDLSGTISGSRLSLDGAGTSFTGVVSGRRLVLSTPGCEPLTLATVSSKEGYVEAVRRLTRTAQTAAARQAAEQRVDQDANVVADDLQTLQSDSSFGGDVSTVQGDLTTLQGDLTTLQGDLRTVQTDVSTQDSAACGDAQSMARDTQSMVSDAQSLENDANTAASDISTTATAMQALESDDTNLRAAEAAAPGYQPANGPAPGSVASAIAAAKHAMASALAAVNSDIDQANADVARGYQLLATAYQAGGCGSPPSTPQPLPHIS